MKRGKSLLIKIRSIEFLAIYLVRLRSWDLALQMEEGTTRGSCNGLNKLRMANSHVCHSLHDLAILFAKQ